MNNSAIDTLWVLMGTTLVFFMQAGFTMLESGLTRAKNTGNIVMKNLMDYAIGSCIFFILGYGLMYGSSGGFAGGIDLFVSGTYKTGTLPLWCHVAYNTVFCTTSATIVSGAMAERTKFKSYLIVSAAMCGIVYPIIGHWVWGGGWLSTLHIGIAHAFIDHAGSSVVNVTGGTAALVGAAFLGPRLGKYKRHGLSHAIPGHNLNLAALGVFILWFGWFGFNATASQTIASEGAADACARILMNTNISAATAACAALTVTWIKYKKPDVTMTLNSVLAGLVAITAGCAVVSPISAAIIGLLAGVIVVWGIDFVDNKLKIDDPVGAVGVHFLNGIWGTLAVGLFSSDTGLIYTGKWGQLLVQCIGVLAIGSFSAILSGIMFKILHETIGLRVSEDAEIAGLDISEHNYVASSADYIPSFQKTDYLKTNPIPVMKESSVPILHTSTESMDPLLDGIHISKVEIICKQNRFEALKNGLNEIGVTGITVTQVLGCGIQKGAVKYYRGVEIEPTLLPKVKVEVVVSTVPVQSVIETARKILYSGRVGDGKIFVSTIDNVVRVRTGEEGYDALQGTDIEEIIVE